MVQCSEQSEDKEDEGNEGYSCLITNSPNCLSFSILVLLYSYNHHKDTGQSKPPLDSRSGR